MAKTAKTQQFDEIGAPVAQTVVRKKRSTQDWMKLKTDAEGEHWRKIKVTIKFRGRLHAGKPKSLNATEAMLKARGLEDAIEAVNVDDPNALAAAAETAADGGLCEFDRREGKPGIWFPANNLKAMLKENWSVLGYRVDYRGSRGALAEGVFVHSCDPLDRDWIRLGDAPDDIEMNVSHTTGPSGAQSSIKRNEYLVGKEISFEIWQATAIANKLPDKALMDMLVHAQEHGTGANRSQGKGTFDIIDVSEID